MKSTLIFTLLPILAAAQFLNVGGRNCQDACENANSVTCGGKTLCECQNHAAVQCYLSRSGRCSLVLEACPVPRGGQPTSNDYPPCGKTLPACAAGATCHKVGSQGTCGGNSNCLGMCIPNIPPPPPKQQQPVKGKGSAPGAVPGAPGAYPGAVPGAAPAAYPGAAPGAAPGAVPGGKGKGQGQGGVGKGGPKGGAGPPQGGPKGPQWGAAPGAGAPGAAPAGLPVAPPAPPAPATIPPAPPAASAAPAAPSPSA